MTLCLNGSKSKFFVMKPKMFCFESSFISYLNWKSCIDIALHLSFLVFAFLLYHSSVKVCSKFEIAHRKSNVKFGLRFIILFLYETKIKRWNFSQKICQISWDFISPLKKFYQKICAHKLFLNVRYFWRFFL